MKIYLKPGALPAEFNRDGHPAYFVGEALYDADVIRLPPPGFTPQHAEHIDEPFENNDVAAQMRELVSLAAGNRFVGYPHLTGTDAFLARLTNAEYESIFGSQE